ncbi:MAG: extracellular solute-binding protein [Gemmatimonadota bacterium]|jgi:iron(III) transport system substrate-binding protein|nr:extracellular solute-binding protein [Gemmatimonadota bacterium]
MSLKRRYVTILTALSLAFLTACGGGDGRQILVVYSPHGPDLLKTFEARFEEANPDVDVQWLDMGSQEVLDRLRSEKANPQADVWFGGPRQLFQAAADEQLIEAYSPPWAAAAAEYSDPQGRFHGVYLTPLMIAYNSAVVDSASAPQEWDDILNPEWADRVLIRDPMASGTMRTIFGMVLQRSIRETGSVDAGFEWLRRLDGQTREYTLNPTILYQKLARQEGVVTLWDLPDILDIQSRGGSYPFGFIFPLTGTPLVEDGVAVVAGAPDQELARRFVDFVGSESEVITAARKHFRLPARSDIPSDSLPETLQRARDVINPEPINWQLLNERGSEWMRYWDDNIRGRG